MGTACTRPRLRRALLLPVLAAAALAAPASAEAGIVVLAGIDVEDGGPGGHGPIASWAGTLAVASSGVTNGGIGWLVVGAGKDRNDEVTRFWSAAAAGAGQPVAFVNGPAIATQRLTGFKAIVVASSRFESPAGGLTDDENDALAARHGEIATFVNQGGGLYGFSQTGLANRYSYVQDIGPLGTGEGLGYNDITATPEGGPLGFGDHLDVCCWHDVYLSYPGTLRALASTKQGAAAAVGGAGVYFDRVTPTTITRRLPACSATGRIPIRLIDNAGGSTPFRLHYRIFGQRTPRISTAVGAGQIATAYMYIPAGRHGVIYNAEDDARNLEPARHVSYTRVDRVHRCRPA